MKNKVQGPQQQGGDGNEKNLRGLVNLGHAYLNQRKLESATEQATKNQDSRWGKRTAVAAIVYTGFTFVIMAATIIQAFVSRDNEERQLRAYISVSNFQAVCCDVDYSGLHYEEFNKLLKIEMKNGGQTPASHVSISMGTQEIGKGVSFPVGMLYRRQVIAGTVERRTPGEPPVIRRAEYYMLQGETKFANAVVDIPTMLRVKNRVSILIIYGTIKYVDVFGKSQATDYCRVWEVYANQTEGYNDCPEHNGGEE